MKTYKLFWLDGKTEIIKGNTIEDAWTKAGLGAGAMSALDYFDVIGGKRPWNIQFTFPDSEVMIWWVIKAESKEEAEALIQEKFPEATCWSIDEVSEEQS